MIAYGIVPAIIGFHLIVLIYRDTIPRGKVCHHLRKTQRLDPRLRPYANTQSWWTRVWFSCCCGHRGRSAVVLPKASNSPTRKTSAAVSCSIVSILARRRAQKDSRNGSKESSGLSRSKLTLSSTRRAPSTSPVSLEHKSQYLQVPMEARRKSHSRLRETSAERPPDLHDEKSLFAERS